MPRAIGTCFDPGIEATLLMRQPGVLKADRVVDDLVSNVDVFATLLEMAETSASTIDTTPHRWSDLCPLLHGDTGSYVPREHVFSGMTWYDRYNPVRAVRMERWKYIQNFCHLPAVYMTTNTSCTHAGREVSEEYYGEQRSYEELYDLEADPLEQENLAADEQLDDPATVAVRDRLREELLEWMETMTDPLLERPVLLNGWKTVHPRMSDNRNDIRN